MEDIEETKQIHKQADMAGNKVGFGDDPAVIVIDLIKAETDPDSEIGYNLDDVVQETNQILAKAHQNDIPVIFTTVYSDHPEHLDFGTLRMKIPSLKSLTPGSEGIQLDERLEVEESDYLLVKKHQSAFHGTDLCSILIADKIDTLIVTGCSTSSCVRATVTDASAYGFRPIIPEDAVGDRSERQHQANLFDMNAKNGDVVETSDVLDYFESGVN